MIRIMLFVVAEKETPQLFSSSKYHDEEEFRRTDIAVKDSDFLLYWV